MAAPSAPLKLYGMSMATCTRRVLTTLEELNVPYELILVDLRQGAHKDAQYISTLQPFGQIPALVDGDLTLFESRAIVRYLLQKYGPSSPLNGTTDAEKALAGVWLEAEAQNYNPPVASLVAEKVFKAWHGKPADEAEVTKQLEAFNKVLDVYEVILSKRPYLAGDHFTVADLSHLPYTDYLLKAGATEPFESRPHVKAWWDKISSRPTWQKVAATA